MIRRLDKNGDIVTSGSMWIYGPESIAVNVQTALRMFLGENFRNKNEGTPWFQDVLGSNKNSAVIAAQIKNRILGVEGVRTITLFKSVYNRESAKLSLNVEIVTNTGEFVKIGEVSI